MDPDLVGAAERVFIYDIASGVIDVNNENTNMQEKQLGRDTIGYLNLNSEAFLFPPGNDKYQDMNVFLDVVWGESGDNDDVLSLPKQRQAAYAGFVVAFNDALDDDERDTLYGEIETGRAAFSSYIMARLMSDFRSE